MAIRALIAAQQAKIEKLTCFLEAFDRNADLLQEQIGSYSFALEALKLGAEEARAITVQKETT